MLRLTANQDTWIKKSTVHSSQLPPHKKKRIKAGQEVVILDFDKVKNSDNIIANLAYGQGKWVVYTPHYKGYSSTPSNIIQTIDWTNMNAKISKHFKVGEVAKWDYRRLPHNDTVKRNAVLLARELDKLRDEYDHPILINSWHRPLFINRQVGSSDNSQHVRGTAADIRPSYGNIYQFQSWVDRHWYGALGYGAKKGFVHVDIRNGKGWKTGGAKSHRWNY